MLEAMDQNLKKIRQALEEKFLPLHLEVEDQSAQHRSHAGAASGGGHYAVTLVAAAFSGKSLVERHRMVHEVLRGLFGGEIHALALKTLTPSEWRPAKG